MTRKDLKYKPNALEKAKFEFSPLGKAFSTGLDETAEGYQEESLIKILKDIRNGLANGVIRPNNMPNRPNDDDDDYGDDDDDDDDMMMMMMIDQIDLMIDKMDLMIDQIDLMIDQIDLMELLVVCF